jgi:hypothetical protein
LKFTLVPNLQDQIKVAQDQNATKAAVISNQTIIIADKDVVIGEKDKQITGRDETIKALKRGNFFRDWLWRLLAFGLGYIAHSK